MTAPTMIAAHGRLARDPDERTTSKGSPMATATIAVEVPSGGRGEEAETETWWLSLLAFGRTAETLARSRKGETVSVMGRLERKPYTASSGEHRDGWQTVARSVRIVGQIGPRGSSCCQLLPVAEYA